MERVKKLIRFCQIYKDLDFYMPRDDEEWLKRFDEFCEKGEKVWIEENLSQNERRRLALQKEEKSRARFERIQSIRFKLFEENDFSEFFQDEKVWLERQEMDERKRNKIRFFEIVSLIADMQKIKFP